MTYQTNNKYTVFFKDGTSFESQGNSMGIRKSPIDEEFKWVAFHIKKEVAQKGKSLEDIEKITYTLTYVDLN